MHGTWNISNCKVLIMYSWRNKALLRPHKLDRFNFILAVLVAVCQHCSTACYHYVILLDMFISSITTAKLGPRPPHFLGFRITHFSERAINSSHWPLPTKHTKAHETNIRPISGIWIRDPSNPATGALRLTLNGYRGSINLLINYVSNIGNWKCQMIKTDARYSQLTSVLRASCK